MQAFSAVNFNLKINLFVSAFVKMATIIFIQTVLYFICCLIKCAAPFSLACIIFALSFTKMSQLSIFNITHERNLDNG